MYKGMLKIVDQNGRIKIRDLGCYGRAIDYAVKMIEIPQKFGWTNSSLKIKSIYTP
jgi:hypothetical protein